MKKILHLTTDNKFIAMALRSFNRVYPNQNTVWVKNKSNDGNLENHTFDKSIRISDLITPKLINEINQYDYVVVHSLDPFWLPLITFLSKDIKLFWIGWGYDYYDLVYEDKSLVFSKTWQLVREGNRSALSKLKSQISLFWKKKLIGKFYSLSTVIEDDYWLLENKIKKLPQYKPWNYGELKTDYVKAVIGKKVFGNSILVGNSASYTNNHIEIFDLIDSFKSERRIIVPLSYGDKNYRYLLKKQFGKYQNIDFHTLEDFIQPNDYTKILLECGNVIMNHVRQQAVGNIVITLYLGARVFLREKNPVYSFLLRHGFVVSSIEQLQSRPKLLDIPLSKSEIDNNVSKLDIIWSLSSIDSKTRKLFDE